MKRLATKENKWKGLLLALLMLIVFMGGGITACSLNERASIDQNDQQMEGIPDIAPAEIPTVPDLPADEPEESEEPNQQPVATESPFSNVKYGWGLVPNDQHLQPEMPDSISNTLSKYDSYWIGDPTEKVLYLTFDNGYENGCTVRILDILKENEVKATFFVTGHYLTDQPELIKRMVAEGHTIGNHTDTHPSLPDVSDEQIVKELQTIEEGYEEITGQNKMLYLRPPQGEYSERTLAVTQELGYYNIFWSIALKDWVPMPGGPPEAYQTIMERLHNGALILLHAVSNDVTEVLDQIIKDAKAQGYTFKTLDDLVGK